MIQKVLQLNAKHIIPICVSTEWCQMIILRENQKIHCLIKTTPFGLEILDRKNNEIDTLMQRNRKREPAYMPLL